MVDNKRDGRFLRLLMALAPVRIRWEPERRLWQAVDILHVPSSIGIGFRVRKEFHKKRSRPRVHRSVIKLALLSHNGGKP